MDNKKFGKLMKDGVFENIIGKEPASGITIYGSSPNGYEELLSELTDEQLHTVIDKIGPTGNGSITVKACMYTTFKRYISDEG